MPIFTLKSRVPHIEPPSERSNAIAKKLTKQKVMPKHSKKAIDNIKKSIGEETAATKKKRKPKGKNPLSCLKKKRAPQTSTTDTKSRKRSRHKKSAPDEIMTLIQKAVEK